MADDGLLQLLHDCDEYVVRQRRLLVRAEVLGFPGDCVAMDAALDQLAASVASAWRAAITEGEGKRKRPSDQLRGDPGG
ncbi:hypothetical protein ACQP2Y_22985 [Actinoplanes sp. CA-051413]|uniref:hypothetical protein n=1 Tax=Actinoplanes sp. CA-051413 TaxID=3239899 RepID=UPI003D98F973